ncbi:MAG: TonB-dependent receptor plug [Caulobacteraceae bacterium]|nr:TonB-dependent receptor plug [Caulobacteraceae bacterium]
MTRQWVPSIARPGPARRWGLSLAALVAGCAAGNARAGAPTIAFNIPPGSLSSELVKFAVEANISIGLGSVDGCAGAGKGLAGRYTVEEGLKRLLKRSGCAYRQLDARAFEIRVAPRSAPAPVVTAREGPMRAELSELVVVATRRSTPIDRLAYAVSSIPRSTLDAQGVHDLRDLTMISPGMTVTNLGMGRDKILLRGLSDGPLTGLTQSLVSLYLDDTRLTFNAPDPDLRLVDIARVEVLRGPQGTLYGSGSLGGVIHIVSAEPDATRRSVWAAASYGFTTGGAPSNAEDAAINVPLLADRAAARLVLYHEVDGGYIRNTYLNINNINRAERDGGRFTVKFSLNKDWDISAGAVVQDILSADTQYATPPGGPYTRNTRLREPSDNNFREYHINVNGDLGWAVAHASAAYIEHKIFDRYAALGPARPVGPPSSSGGFDDLDERSRIQSVVTEETLTSEGPARVQWLAGFFYAHTTQTSSFADSAPGPPTVVSYSDVRHDGLDEGAFYGQAEVPLYAGWTVTAGGRVFASRDRVNSLSTVRSRQVTSFSGVVDQVGFTPKIVISDRPLPDLLVYVQADQGYRPPGINTAAAPGEVLGAPGGKEPLRYFKSDQLWSFEAGAKITTLDGRLRINVAGFDVQWKGVQSDQLLLLPSGLPFTANVGDGRNLGVEIETAFRTGALELQADMLFDHPRLYRANTAAFPLLADSSLGAVPDQEVGFSAHYSWKLGNRLSFALDGRWIYVGGSHLMLNIASLPKEGNYNTGRLAASLIDQNWRFTVAVDNPADDHPDTFAYGNPFLLRTVRQTTPLRPRTVTLSAEASF